MVNGKIKEKERNECPPRNAHDGFPGQTYYDRLFFFIAPRNVTSGNFRLPVQKYPGYSIDLTRKYGGHSLLPLAVVIKAGLNLALHNRSCHL